MHTVQGFLDETLWKKKEKFLRKKVVEVKEVKEIKKCRNWK
jgi:hypothetical protein